MNIICAKCKAPVNEWEYYDDPRNENRIVTVKCHGESETRTVNKFLLGKEYTSKEIEQLPMEAFNEFQIKQLNNL